MSLTLRTVIGTPVSVTNAGIIGTALAVATTRVRALGTDQREQHGRHERQLQDHSLHFSRTTKQSVMYSWPMEVIILHRRLIPLDFPLAKKYVERKAGSLPESS